MVRISALLTASLAATASGLVAFGREGSTAAEGLKLGVEASRVSALQRQQDVRRETAEADRSYARLMQQTLERASNRLLKMVAAPPSGASGGGDDASKSKNSTKQQEVLAKQKESLKTLLSNMKSSIENLNKAETQGKETGKQQIEKIEKRLEHEREELKQKNLTDFRRQLLANRTQTDERELKYWTRSRELQQGMFHANLKMTHGLMSKAHTVLEAYEAVMAGGKLSDDLAKQLKAVSGSLPREPASSPASSSPAAPAQPKPAAAKKGQPDQQKATAQQEKPLPQKKA